MQTRKIFRAVAVSVLGALLAAPAWSASVTWDVSLWGKRRAFTENVEKIAERVAAKTDGDFMLNISYGGLSKPRENLDGIAIGAFQMAQFCAFYHPDKNPTITVAELPFSHDLTLAQTANIQMQLLAHPTVQKDLGRWGATPLMPTPLPQYNLVSKSTPPKKLQDFAGLRIRGPGGILGVLGKLGVIKASVPFTEVRPAMDAGVIDAASFAPHAHLATKTFRAGKWATTNLNLGTANCPVVVSTAALDELSPEHRDALLGSVAEALEHYVQNYNAKTTRQYQRELGQSGLKLITFDAAQTAELSRLSESVRRAWVAKYKSKFNARALFNFTQELVDAVN